jgi:hypothetical protein
VLCEGVFDFTIVSRSATGAPEVRGTVVVRVLELALRAAISAADWAGIVGGLGCDGRGVFSGIGVVELPLGRRGFARDRSFLIMGTAGVGVLELLVRAGVSPGGSGADRAVEGGGTGCDGRCPLSEVGVDVLPLGRGVVACGAIFSRKDE